MQPVPTVVLPMSSPVTSRVPRDADAVRKNLDRGKNGPKSVIALPA